MSNPYLNFLASLGGPKGSHSTLKKLASTSTTTLTTTTTTTTNSSSSPNSLTAAPRTSSLSSSRSHHSSHSSHSTRPSSSSSSSKPRPTSSTLDSRGSVGSNRKSHSSSSSSRNHDRADSRNYANGHDRPYSNDSRVSKSFGSSTKGSINSSGSGTNSRRDNSRDRASHSSSSLKNERKRDRDSDISHPDVSRAGSGSGSGSGSRISTKDAAYAESRARKRHATSRSWSRSRSGSRSRSKSRSKSPSRSRIMSRSSSRSRSPVVVKKQLQKQEQEQEREQAPLQPPQPQQQQSTRASTPPPPVHRTPSPKPQSTYPDIDDTSSFSTLSSPASFSPSPSPRSMPPSPNKELTPIKKRRMESTLQAEASYSSPSSLSSLSPDRSNRASLDWESGHGYLEPSPFILTMLESQDAAMVTNTLPKKFASQHSLEMELFGMTDDCAKDRADVDPVEKGAGTKIVTKKQENGSAPKLAPAVLKKISVDDDGEEYGSLGSFNKDRDMGKMKSNGRSESQPKRQSGKSSKEPESREIVTINTDKGTVTSSIVPVSALTLKASQGNGNRPTKPSPSSTTKEAKKEDSQKPAPLSTNGSAPRRMSILHSDQIIAAAMNRYKNHFHMIVEDSDSTVASNPSSTGADTMHVSLEYPGKDAREKFTLMKPFLSRSKDESEDKDEYNPIEDLVSTVKVIMENFFSQEKSKELFGTSTEGLYRNLSKFKNRRDGAQFMKAVEDFNQIMRAQKLSGAIQGHMKQYGHRLPYELVVHILQQVYSRTVAARASKLNQYEAFSNNVYGEILPILTKEFIRRTKMDQSKVFVDLGCGIGNVVLQVALQTGAESYGVEIMETPAKFSKKQAKEFEARSRAYGLHHGPVTMIQGDFLDTAGLPGILARADVVLVNNYAFNSALNQSLLQLFLDLKEGCKIISLKTFVPLDHKINVRNASSVESILRVKKYPYYTNAVSWTHNGGEYYIATVDRSAVHAFWERAYADGGASLDDGGGRRSSTRRR